MIDWFRSWHGAPTDPKWRTVARRASVRPGDVAAVAWVLLDRASQAADRGSIAGYDSEVIADALGYEPDEVDRIIDAMIDKGVIVDSRLSSWDKYQPKRERPQDDSSERVKTHRDKKRHVTPCNASDDPETPREDTDTDIPKANAFGAAAPRDEREILFRDGLAGVRRLTGKPDQQCRTLIGRWLKLANDDCVAVRRTIEDAERDRPAEPVAWIEAHFRPRTTGPPTFAPRVMTAI